jgi:ribonuclease HIII
MNQSVIQVSKDEVVQVVNRLRQISDIEILAPTNQYEILRTRFHDGLIIVYTSGKIVSYGNDSKELVVAMIQDMASPLIDVDALVGSDEAGKGEWLGPMVTAAVAIKPEDVSILRSEGVMDSKSLKVETIRVLSKHITKIALAQHIVTISPARFNSFFAEVKNEGRTLNDMLAWSHYRVISDVYKVLCSKDLRRIQVIIDEFDKVKTEKRLVHLVNKDNVTLIQKPNAEEEIPVAAASIMARYARERWIDREEEKRGFNLRELTPKEVLELSEPRRLVKLSYIK